MTAEDINGWQQSEEKKTGQAVCVRMADVHGLFVLLRGLRYGEKSEFDGTIEKLGEYNYQS